MNYSFATIWHDRARYLPGIGAVAFSAVLMALQSGLLYGLFKITSIPIDRSRADVWVGSPKVLSVDLGRPIPLSFYSRIASDNRVESIESYYQAFSSWIKPDGSSELCIVIGSNLNDGNLGSVDALTPDLRLKLTEPDTIVIDSGERERLGVSGIGDHAEINKHRVRVVGEIKGMKSLAGPYVLTSRTTAQKLLRAVNPKDHQTYFLVRCKNPSDASALVEDLNNEFGVRGDMSAFTAEDFSQRSQWHWLLKTKAGIALGYTALLGLFVGAIITSQTLYAATAASSKEYAILLAMGIPRWRLTSTVLIQSFWIGLFGLILAYPTVHALALLGGLTGVAIQLPWEIMTVSACLTMVMAMFAGLFALRSIRGIEPMSLLR
jgi:putative ABC transport system permease protein